MDTQKMKVQKLVPTEYDGKWGFIDAATGEEVVPFIYDYAHAFSVGLALVRQNGWWGYVLSLIHIFRMLVVEEG